MRDCADALRTQRRRRRQRQKPSTANSQHTYIYECMHTVHTVYIHIYKAFPIREIIVYGTIWIIFVCIFMQFCLINAFKFEFITSIVYFHVHRTYMWFSLHNRRVKHCRYRMINYGIWLSFWIRDTSIKSIHATKSIAKYVANFHFFFQSISLEGFSLWLHDFMSMVDLKRIESYFIHARMIFFSFCVYQMVKLNRTLFQYPLENARFE